MSLYAYCLAGAPCTPALAAVVGVAGARPHLISYGSIVAVVSEIGAERVALSRGAVLAHQRVIERVLAQTTPLPFRFGTVVSAEQLEAYLRAHEERLREMLARVRGCVEMSVKVLWNEEAMEATAGEYAASGSQHSSQPLGPGAQFLQMKRRERVRIDTRKRQAEEMVMAMAASLGDIVQESVVRVEPERALVIRAAYLVERARLEEYRERLRGVWEERGPLRFLSSGPWPPYSFCDLTAGTTA